MSSRSDICSGMLVAAASIIGSAAGIARSVFPPALDPLFVACNTPAEMVTSRPMDNVLYAIPGTTDAPCGADGAGWRKEAR